jgi:two-component system sensor histidine kinase KdpD
MRKTLFNGALLPLVGCTAVAVAGVALRDNILPENQVLLFLLLVILVTVKLGRLAGSVCALASVLLYDLFLVPPYLSLEVHDAQHLLTFALILVVALITGHFVDGIRVQHRMALEREEQANALREMSVALAGASDMASVCAVGANYVQRMFGGISKVFVKGDEGAPVLAASAGREVRLPSGVSRVAAALMGESPGRQEHPFYSAGAFYFILHTPAGIGGVLVCLPDHGNSRLPSTDERLAQVAAQQLAMTIERVRLSDLAALSQLEVKAERFRNSLLNSVSHDLRTPLAALNGLAGQLLAQGHGESALPAAIARVAQRLDSMVGNLLELARFSQGGIQLRQDWQLIDEVIGSAITQVREHGGKLRYLSAVHGGPNLVRFDARLIERVLCNLLENAERHAAGASMVRVRAASRCGRLHVLVCDDGSGIAEGAARPPAGGDISQGDTRPGLGLSICRAIIEAHAGELNIARRRGGGTRAAFSLPMTEPPVLEPDEQAARPDH